MSENEEKRPEVGKKLHDARVAKGYTLDDLQQATKIQKRYLIAIEDEKFDELPGDFYVRAFVKQYADTVGLDGEDLLKEYDDDLPKAKTDEYSEHIAQAVETRATSKRKLTKVNDARKYLPTVIAIVIVVIVLAAIWLTAIVRGHRDSSTKIDNSSVKVSGESSKKSSSSKKTSDSIKLTASTRTSSAVTFTGDALTKDTTLTIKTSGQAWNAVTVDNSQRLSKTMSANQTEKINIAKNAQTIVLTLGNASATTVKLGNTTVDLTQNNTYPNTRTVTIKLGNTTQSSSASSTSSSAVTTSTSQSTSSTAGSGTTSGVASTSSTQTSVSSTR